MIHFSLSPTLERLRMYSSTISAIILYIQALSTRVSNESGRVVYELKASLLSGYHSRKAPLSKNNNV